MNKSNETVVTKLLSDREILKRQDIPYLFEGKPAYATNRNYDLTDYLSRPKREVSRFGEKYLFVK